MIKGFKKIILCALITSIFVGGFIYLTINNPKKSILSNNLKDKDTTFQQMNKEDEEVKDEETKDKEIKDKEIEDEEIREEETKDKEIQIEYSNAEIQEAEEEENFQDIVINESSYEEEDYKENEWENVQTDTQTDTQTDNQNDIQYDETEDSSEVIEEITTEKTVVIEEEPEKEYKPIGRANVEGKFIFEYDNVNISYLGRSPEGIDTYIFYVWDGEVGWAKTWTHRFSVPDNVGESMEWKLYAYTDDVNYIAEDRIYTVELIIYPHKDRISESKCNIYTNDGELIISKPVNM